MQDSFSHLENKWTGTTRPIAAFCCFLTDLPSWTGKIPIQTAEHNILKHMIDPRESKYILLLTSPTTDFCFLTWKGKLYQQQIITFYP